jgi:hypothetical protein
MNSAMKTIAILFTASAVFAAPTRMTRRNDFFGFPGTNDNAPGFDAPPPSFSLTGAPVNIECLSDVSCQPLKPDTRRCGISSYQHELGKHSLFPLQPEDLKITDVKQGYLGDCGFGAALMTLIANGHKSDIINSLTLATDNTMTAHFKTVKSNLQKRNGAPPVGRVTTTDVAIDDQLPSSSECGDGVRFQNSAEGVTYVPFLEKAWAKYVDVNTQFRSRNVDDTGYFGLTGTSPAEVMKAITGRNAVSTFRSKPTGDMDIINTLAWCVHFNLPCVVGTPSLLEDGGVWGLPKPNIFGRITTDNALMYADKGSSDIPGTIGVVDLEQVTGLRFVPDHAYAVIGVELTEEGNLVELLNPWGWNPSVKDVGYQEENKSLKISFSALTDFASSVYYLAKE